MNLSEKTLRATINSWHGLIAVTRSEAAFREELALLAVGVPLAFFLTGDVGERFALIGTLFFIFIVELLNTAIEKLSDRPVTPIPASSASRTWAPPPFCCRCSPLARPGFWVAAERFWRRNGW
jgi:diacylglycerol kinase